MWMWREFQSMKYWSREDTKSWVAQLEDRIEDIAHYVDLTAEWCEENEVYSDRVVFICMFVTCIWVSQLRCEPITYVELMEMLGISDVEVDSEKFYELDDEYIDMTHTELLRKTVKTFEDNGI
jgi:hypothetical protein